MNIAIIGAGKVGSALAKGLAKAGHQITLGVRNRNSDKVRNLTKEKQNISADSISEASAKNDVIIVATPASAVTEVAGNLGDVRDKVIIDATNSIFSTPETHDTASDILHDLTDSSHIVKCFNSTGYENLENPQFGDVAIDMFVAGSSEKGKQTAIKLAKDIGFANCYDFGGDDKIPLLEDLAMCWINLAIMQKLGRDIAFKILKR